jgi:two-component system phosphate regulon sensor histidine kinase PhoR
VIRGRFLWKLYAGYAAVILLSVLTIGLLVTRQITENSMAEIRNELDDKAFLLRQIALDALRTGEAGDLQARVAEVAAHNPERLTVIRGDGLVLADSLRDPRSMDNHARRPEVLEATERGSGRAVRFSRTLGTRLMYVALKVELDGRRLGWVRTSLPLVKIDERLAALRARVLIGGIAAVVLGLILGFVLARSVTRPLTSMTDVAKALAAGDYARRVATGSPGEVGVLARAFNSMADVLRERMETITEDRNKVLAILRSMVEGLVAVDRDQRIVLINSLAARLLKAPPTGSSVGQRIWEVTRVQEVCNLVEKTLQSGRDHESELRIPTGRNDQIVEMCSSPLRAAEGATVGAVVLLHDVTDQRRLETMRRDFVANVSHELKTPLTAIRGLVETLLDDPDMEPDIRRRFLEKVNTQSGRLTALVTDLLALSRLESEEEQLKRRHLDLRRPIADSYERNQSDFEAAGLTADLEMASAPVPVLADAEALAQMADNLMQNAVRYTPEEGRITVRVKHEGETALLEVEDTGIGIDPRHHARIFERFYRVDTARSREIGGTGLGLAIVKHIAQAHGGQVSVESEPGEGTTFSVRIPITEA